MSDTAVKTAGFALNLLRKEVAAKPTETVNTSTLSVSLALGMTANGARSRTLEQMLAGLGLTGMDLATMNAGYLGLLTGLKRTGLGVKLMLANAIFARSGFDFYETFLNANRDFFNAMVKDLPFDDASATYMNTWCSNNTKLNQKDKKGLITKVVKAPIDASTVMFLINCLVFNGEWTTKFDPKLTTDQDFQLGDGGTKKVPLMYRKSAMAHGSDWINNVYETMTLPFGTSKEVREVFFLPTQGNTVHDVLNVLTEEKLLQWAGNTHDSEGELWLPRLKIRYDNKLNDSLKALGMEDLFDRGACDLSGMRQVPPNLFVQEVAHQTVFELDEFGARGAAVTKVKVGLESFSAPYAMRMDKPFLKFTIDTRTGGVIFAGAVNDPQSDAEAKAA